MGKFFLGVVVPGCLLLQLTRSTPARLLPPASLCRLAEETELPVFAPPSYVSPNAELFLETLEKLAQQARKQHENSGDLDSLFFYLEQIYSLLERDASLLRMLRHENYNSYLLILSRIHMYGEALLYLAGGNFRQFVDSLLPSVFLSFWLEDARDSLRKRAAVPPEYIGYLVYDSRKNTYSLRLIPNRVYPYWRAYRYELRKAYDSGDSVYLQDLLDQIKSFSGHTILLIQALYEEANAILQQQYDPYVSHQVIATARYFQYLTRPFMPEHLDRSLLFFYSLDKPQQQFFLDFLLQFSGMVSGLDYARLLCETLPRGVFPVVDFHTHPLVDPRLFRSVPPAHRRFLAQNLNVKRTHLLLSSVDWEFIGYARIPHFIIGHVFGSEEIAEMDEEIPAFAITLAVPPYDWREYVMLPGKEKFALHRSFSYEEFLSALLRSIQKVRFVR